MVARCIKGTYEEVCLPPLYHSNKATVAIPARGWGEIPGFYRSGGYGVFGMPGRKRQ